MQVQPGGVFTEVASLPADPQCDMISRQQAFQRRLGIWDDRISSRFPTFVLPGRAIHNLDCAVQEASEAWDMVEGGWKHHKKNPVPVDRTELLLELVDVASYVYNAHLCLGGRAEGELIAKDYAACREISIVPSRADLDFFWNAAGSEPVSKITRALYYHGKDAHGEGWVKDAAAWINRLRASIVDSATALRAGLQQMSRSQRAPEAFPPGPGFIPDQVFTILYGAVRSLPDATMLEFYSAFVHKNEINNKRQSDGY